MFASSYVANTLHRSTTLSNQCNVSVAGNNQNAVVIRLESLYLDMIEVDSCYDCIPGIVFTIIKNAMQLLEPIAMSSHLTTTSPGKPSFDLPMSCIENLMELGFHTRDWHYTRCLKKHCMLENEGIWFIVLSKLLLYHRPKP